jgi:hypothetical protein
MGLFFYLNQQPYLWGKNQCKQKGILEDIHFLFWEISSKLWVKSSDFLESSIFYHDPSSDFYKKIQIFQGDLFVICSHWKASALKFPLVSPLI